MADDEIQAIAVEAEVVDEEPAAENDRNGVIVGKPYIIIALISILALILSNAYFIYLSIDNSRTISNYQAKIQELKDTEQKLSASEQNIESYKTTIAEHEKTIAEQESTISSYKTKIDNYETLLADIAKSNSERNSAASAPASNGGTSLNIYSASAENEDVCAVPDCNNSPQRNSHYCFRHECLEVSCHEKRANDLCLYCINHKCAVPDCNSGQAYNSYYCYRHKQ